MSRDGIGWDAQWNRGPEGGKDFASRTFLGCHQITLPQIDLGFAGWRHFILFVQQLCAGCVLCVRPRAGRRGHRSDQDRPSPYPPRAPSNGGGKLPNKGASISHSDRCRDRRPRRGDKTEYLRGKRNPRRQGRLCGRQCEDRQGIGTVPCRAPEILSHSKSKTVTFQGGTRLTSPAMG